MPMYAYECKENGHQFEVRQSFDDDPISECPECGSAVRRLIQPAGILFKGSGFYVTDNKKAKSPTSTPSSDKSSNGSKSESGSETKTESKSAETKSSSTEKASTSVSSAAD